MSDSGDRTGDGPVTGPTVVERYFRALEGGDADGAAACFSPDAVYSHPPYPDDDPMQAGRASGQRVEVRGRPAIHDLFRRRGPRPTTHVVTAVAGAGDAIFVEGVATSPQSEAFASYVAVARLDRAGLISHYSAYTARPVPGSLVGAPLNRRPAT